MTNNQPQRWLWMGGLFFVLTAFGACSNNESSVSAKKTDDPNVIIHSLDDPKVLNPLMSTGANASHIEGNIFESLLTIDTETLEMKPYLAVSRPEVKELTEGPYAGSISLSYEIRPEATWDNGEPITGYDYLFTMKAINHPLVEAQNLRAYTELLDSVYINPENPKQFTVFFKKRYMLAEPISGFIIMPSYAYDPNGYLKNVSLSSLKKAAADPALTEQLKQNEALKTFADNFNAVETGQDPKKVVGSGPYRLAEWQSDVRLVLERKKDWWGDKVDNPDIEAVPPKIIYSIIPNKSTAVTAMKDESIDIMQGIEARSFKQLQEDSFYSKVYRLESPTQFSYTTIGFNFNEPKLQDLRVRRAMAHLMDREQIIEVLYYGMATKINGPIHPKKRYYNKEIPDIPFDPKKAAALLKEAGWEDTDKDGILDKEINGTREPLSLTYLVNAESKERRKIGIMFQDAAKEVGIDLSIKVLEFKVYIEEISKRNFDLVALAWLQSPFDDDLKQIWHSSSAVPNGGNRIDYKSPELDSLIDNLRVTLDKDKRDEMYKALQWHLYENQPNIFLIAPKSRLSIHSRFGNAETSVVRPGYYERYFTVSPTTKAVAD